MTGRVCIDGFNLSMEKGSGITTYARCLHDSLAGLGFETQLLLGPPREPGGNALLNEIALSDGVPVKSARKSVSRFLSNRTSRPVREAVVVRRSGEVIAPRTEIIDRADLIWSCQDVFHTANWDYGAHGRFTELAGASRLAHLHQRYRVIVMKLFPSRLQCNGMGVHCKRVTRLPNAIEQVGVIVKSVGVGGVVMNG